MDARWKASDGPEGLRVEIPVPRLWPVILFLGLWLCGWAAGEVSALASLPRARGAGLAFLLFWLAGWTAGGLFALGLFLLLAAGKEVVLLGGGTLRLGGEVLGMRLCKSYEAARVKGLRVADAPAQVPGRKAVLGTLQFEHDGKTVRFAYGLTVEEAAHLAAMLQSRYRFSP